MGAKGVLTFAFGISTCRHCEALNSRVHTKLVLYI
jgi:hypothetical protein